MAGKDQILELRLPGNEEKDRKKGYKDVGYCP